MNFISHQAAVGAFVATALMLGASASPQTRPSAPPHNASTIGAQLTLSSVGFRADLAEVLQTCRDKALDVALDAVGEITARLKQL